MYDDGYCSMGPRGRFYSYIYIYIYICLVMLMIGTGCSWVELPGQRRLCPIFVRNVGSPDIHECFRGLTGSQRTSGISVSQLGIIAWVYGYLGLEGILADAIFFEV